MSHTAAVRRGRRCRSVCVLPVCVSLLLALPVGGARAAAPSQQPDWMAKFAGNSPTCRQALTGPAAANCRQSASVTSAYPVSHYQFDWHIDTGITKWENDLAAAFQWVAAAIWTVTLLVLNLVLTALQWAFSLDIVHAALAPLRIALDHLHNDVLGRSWQTVAIGILALGAMFHAVVRRDTKEGVLGSAAAIVLIGVGVYVIQKPVETLGPFSSLANNAGGGFLAGAAAGDPSHPDQGVADASRQIFDTAVTRPWCAIEFGDVNWCESHAQGQPGGLTWGARWLRYGVDSNERNAEYDALAGNDLPGTGQSFLGLCDICVPDHTQSFRAQVAGIHKDPKRVAFQTSGATIFRAAIVAAMCFGLWCAVLLMGWLVAMLFVQSVAELALILAAPLVCFAPAFGRRGRAVFRKWLGLLAFTVLARAIYALGLAIVITLTGVLATVASALPYGIGWALVAGAWFFAFKKRNALLEKLSAGQHNRDDVRTLSQSARNGLPQAIGAVGLTARGARRTGRGMWAVGRFPDRTVRGRRDREAGAVKQSARDELRTQAQRRLDDRFEAQTAQLAKHDDAKAKIAGLDKRVGANDREGGVIAQQLKRTKDPAERTQLAARKAALGKERGKLVGQRKNLEGQLMAPLAEGPARKFVEAGNRNQVEQGRRFTDRQLDLQLDELRSDTQQPAAGDDPEHAWRLRTWKPGIPEGQLATLPAAQLAAMRYGHIEHDMARDRALFEGVPEREELDPGRKQARTARQHIAGEILAAKRDELAENRRAQIREQRNQERLRRKARRGLPARR